MQLSEVKFVYIHAPELRGLRVEPETAAPETATTARPAPPPFDGRAVWASLHRRALTWDAGDDSEWLLREITAKLPCGDCAAHWVIVMHTLPVRWGDYFAWSVEAHNAVNRRLGKPELAVDQARAVWSALRVDNPPR